MGILILVLFLHCLGWFLIKPTKNSLYCGLFGYVGIERKLNKKTFYTLGCANDSRGGDSCGIFIDGKYEYGVGEKKLFSSLLTSSTLLQDTHMAKIALGHCRKASVGAINALTAQPVVITNDTNEVDFVLLHNGTLFNHNALAKKYLKNVPEYYTDSQIMAYSIYYHGFGVLSEYEGGGAFVMVDYRKNRKDPFVYLFKGASKLHAYSTEETEERPLFFSLENKGIWFSSMCMFLITTRLDEGVVRSVKSNTLYTIHKGEILEKKAIDRSKKSQTKTYNNYWAEEGYYYDEDEWDYKPIRTLPEVTPRHNTFDRTCPTTILTSVFAEATDLYAKDKLSFSKGQYLINRKLAHGKYNVGTYGYVYADDYANPNLAREVLYFYQGVLLFNKESFDVIERLRELFSIKDLCDFSESFPEVIYHYSNMPYFDIADHKYVTYINSMESPEVFDSTYSALFNTKELCYKIVNGNIISRTEYPYSDTKYLLKDFLHLAESRKYVVEEEVKKICDTFGYVNS